MRKPELSGALTSLSEHSLRYPDRRKSSNPCARAFTRRVTPFTRFTAADCRAVADGARREGRGI
jgi:hypothetical protein